MNKKEDIRIKRSKYELNAALYKLLKEKSFSKITVIDICETANINRMTFYNHYQDKYDLSNESILNGFRLLREEYDKRTKHLDIHKDVYECLSILAEIFVEFVYNNVPVLNHILERNEDNLASFMFNRALDESFSNVILDAGFNDSMNPPISLVIAFFAGGSSSLFEYWINHKDSISKEEFLSYIKRAIKAVIDTNILKKI